MSRSSASSSTKPRSNWIQTETGNLVSRSCLISGPQNILLGGKSILQPGCILRGDLRRAGAGGGGPGGKEAATVTLAMGKYCNVGENTVLRPCYKTYKGMFSYYPMKIGDLVTIGAGSVVEAATIGNGVEIGKGCIIVRPPFSRSRSSHSEFRHGRVIPPFWRRGGGVGDAGGSMVTDCLDADEALTAASAAQGPLVILKDFCKVADGAVVGAGTVVQSLTEWGGSPARLIGQLPESTPEAVESKAKNAYLNFRPD